MLWRVGTPRDTWDLTRICAREARSWGQSGACRAGPAASDASRQLLCASAFLALILLGLVRCQCLTARPFSVLHVVLVLPAQPRAKTRSDRGGNQPGAAVAPGQRATSPSVRGFAFSPPAFSSAIVLKGGTGIFLCPVSWVRALSACASPLRAGGAGE